MNFEVLSMENHLTRVRIDGKSIGSAFEILTEMRLEEHVGSDKADMERGHEVKRTAGSDTRHCFKGRRGLSGRQGCWLLGKANHIGGSVAKLADWRIIREE